MYRIVLLILVTISMVGTAHAQSSATKGKAILVLLKQQQLYAVVDGKAIYQFHCSTGRTGNSTPTGQTTVQQKLRFNRALPKFGGGPIPYSLRIHVVDPKTKKKRRINIHAYDSVPNYPASHGCVRLSPANAKKLFEWADVGTPVVIMTGPAIKTKKVS